LGTAMSKRDQRFRGGSAHAADSLPIEEVEARAARLGITPERIIEELRAIAFADITRIVSWDTERLTMTASCQLPKTDAAAIAEIIASAKGQKIYRVKLHDKTPALALLTRILEKFTNQDEQVDNDADGAREFLIQELDRLAAEGGDAADDPGAGR
jgi:hypothetical protein